MQEQTAKRFAIAATIVVLVLGGFLVGYVARGSTTTPQPTPRATALPTDTPRPVPTKTAVAGVATQTSQLPPTPVGQAQPVKAATTRWTDSSGHVSVQYPSSWPASRNRDNPANAVQFETDGVNCFIDITTPDASVSLADEARNYARTRANQVPGFTFSFAPPRTATVGGKPAQMMSFTFANTTDPGNTGEGMVWLVDAGGKRYLFNCSDTRRHGREIADLIGSVVFS